jgi:hypothetical protein
MKAPTQLRTERGHLQDMKLSVLNSTSRQGRVSSLTATNEAILNFHDQKYPQLKSAATQFSCVASTMLRRLSEQTSEVYTINHQGGK